MGAEQASPLHHVLPPMETNLAPAAAGGDPLGLSAASSTLVRKSLSDITNLTTDGRVAVAKSFADATKENPPTPAAARNAYVSQLLKENNALMRVLEELIELSAAEIQNLQFVLQKLTQQNHQLAQANSQLIAAHRIRFEFHKAAAKHTFMRIDGEPWKQPLPMNDDTVVVEISHLGLIKMLATRNCISKSTDDPSMPMGNHDEESPNSEDEWEEKRKFGAADTFKFRRMWTLPI